MLDVSVCYNICIFLLIQAGESLEFVGKVEVTNRISPRCVEVFEELKIRRRHRYLIFKLGEEEIEVEKVGGRKEVGCDFSPLFCRDFSILIIFTLNDSRRMMSSRNPCLLPTAAMVSMIKTTRLPMGVLHPSCGLSRGSPRTLQRITRWHIPLLKGSSVRYFLVHLMCKCLA